MKNSLRVGSISLISFALLYFSSIVFLSPIFGFEDGDNPAVTLEFLRDHANLYFLSGFASVLAAVALTTAVLAIQDALPHLTSSLLMRVTTIFGLFTAAFFFGNGVLHIQAPGTLIYIESLDPDWGLAAYLAVQMAGTQGLGSAGVFGFSFWAIGLSIAGWGRGGFPRLLSLLGVLPALPWLMGLLGRLGLLPEGLWLLYIGSIILGVPLWCILLGVVLWRRSYNRQGGS